MSQSLLSKKSKSLREKGGFLSGMGAALLDLIDAFADVADVLDFG